MPTIQELLPGVEQRFCMHHLYANFRKKFGGKKLKNLMSRVAVSTYPQAWEREMRNIKEVNLEAYKYLIAIPPRFVFIIHIHNTVRHYDDANLCMTLSFSDFGPDLGSQLKPSMTLW